MKLYNCALNFKCKNKPLQTHLKINKNKISKTIITIKNKSNKMSKK